MGKNRGVDIREQSIRITFSYQGKQHKHTLKTDGVPMLPTKLNIRYAERLAEEIRQRIRLGVFSLQEYFPDDAKATSGTGVTSVGQRLELWLGLQTALKESTVKSYRVSVDWWIDQIGDKPINALVHSDILKALATKPEWSGKTRNNRVIPLRQALALTMRDGLIKNNPLDGLEAASHQRPEPDPLQQEEVQLIIDHLEQRFGEAIANYFGFKFYTGLRTGESLGLRWTSIDWRSKTMLIKEGLVMGQHVTSTKTSKTRTVQLNTKALFYLQRQKAHTFLLPDGWVFVDPKTNKRWVDDWGPRNTYWEPTLRKLGLRYRSPYQTRHTYATMLLMAGVTPAFAAKQMGHSTQVFIEKYARWIDGGINDLEMGKLEGLLSHQTKTDPGAALG